MKPFILRAVACLATLALLLLPTPSQSADAVTFKGQQVTILVGYGAGGSYDTYARLVARYLGKYLPGNPTVIVQNMAGAGSLTAANYLYNVAPKDGTTLGVIDQTLPIDQVLGTESVSFDVTKFDWIGRIALGVETIVSWNTSPVKTINDAKKDTLETAATGPSSSSAVYPMLLNNLLGTKFKLLRGYSGTNEMLLAMQRGEAAGCGSVNLALLTSSHAAWLTDKKINVLVQFALHRQPAIPNVPAVVELGQTPLQTQVLRLFGSAGEIGRSIMAPPGIPPDRLKTLRSAFMAMAKDPELVAFSKQSKLDIEPLDGESLQKLVQDVGTTSKATVAAAKAATTVTP